jgi:hypothetical protein
VPSGTWAADGWGNGRVHAVAHGAVSTIGRGFSAARVAGYLRRFDARGDGRRQTWTVCPGRNGTLGASPPTLCRRKADWQARRTNPQKLSLSFRRSPPQAASGGKKGRWGRVAWRLAFQSLLRRRGVGGGKTSRGSRALPGCDGRRGWYLGLERAGAFGIPGADVEARTKRCTCGLEMIC